jgi:hypothetical protein
MDTATTPPNAPTTNTTAPQTFSDIKIICTQRKKVSLKLNTI